MDPVTIGLGLVAASLVAKALIRAEDAVVDAGASAVSRLIAWLKERFSGEDATVLSRLEEAPDSPAREKALAETIAVHADADLDFAAELEKLLTAVENAGGEVWQASQSATGDQNVQIANVKGARVEVTRGGQSARGATPGAG